MSSSPSPQKKIRKRQPCACDACRKGKRKCDGKSPCGRCEQHRKLCTYTTTKRPSRKTQLPDVVPVINSLESEMANENLASKFIDLYFTKINPGMKMIGFSNPSPGDPSSKSVMLQYNSIMAASTRAFSSKDKTLYKHFANRAQQLSAELIEDFTVDTALGFTIYSQYLWGEDDVKACHFKEITTSLCKRTAAKPENNANAAKLLFLEYSVCSISELDSVICGRTSCTSIQERCEKLGPSGALLQSFSFVDRLMNKMGRVLFKDPNDPGFIISPFETVSSQVHLNLLSELEEAEKLFFRLFSIVEGVSIITICCKTILKSIMYYTVGKPAVAIAYIRETVQTLESNQYLIPSCNPFFIGACHLIFLISYDQKELILANRICGIQRQFADLFPSGRYLLERDMELLKSVDLPNEKIRFHEPTVFTKPFQPPAPLVSVEIETLTPSVVPSSPFNFQPSHIHNINPTPNIITQMKEEPPIGYDSFLSCILRDTPKF